MIEITIGAISRPMEAKKIKTGDWGTEYPVVDVEKCSGCKSCEMFCPDLCVEVVKENRKKYAVFDYNYCKGCGVCAFVCPEDAIRMEMKEIYKLEVE